MARSIKTNDTDDKESARGAFIDALIRSKTAVADHPKLDTPARQLVIQDVLREAQGFTAFVSGKDKFWIDHVKASGSNQPYSKVKLQFMSRSFTPKDTAALEAHLKQLGIATIGQVTHSDGKSRVNIHILL